MVDLKTKVTHFPTQISSHSRQLAAVSYIPLIGLLALFSRTRDRFVTFHALQGTLLAIYFLLSYLLIPRFGAYLALVFAALAAVGFIQTSGGQNYRLPLVADFVDWMVAVFDKRKTAR